MNWTAQRTEAEGYRCAVALRVLCAIEYSFHIRIIFETWRTTIIPTRPAESPSKSRHTSPSPNFRRLAPPIAPTSSTRSSATMHSLNCPVKTTPSRLKTASALPGRIRSSSKDFRAISSRTLKTMSTSSSSSHPRAHPRGSKLPSACPPTLASSLSSA